MPLLSYRVLVPLAIVVLAWGGLHALGGHPAAVSPATWPGGTDAPATQAAAAVPASPASPPPSPSASGNAGIPLLPGALQQLNGSTRDTAVGLYALIQQIEEALRAHLQQLAQQLEPGR